MPRKDGQDRRGQLFQDDTEEDFSGEEESEEEKV